MMRLTIVVVLMTALIVIPSWTSPAAAFGILFGLLLFPVILTVMLAPVISRQWPHDTGWSAPRKRKDNREKLKHQPETLLTSDGEILDVIDETWEKP